MSKIYEKYLKLKLENKEKIYIFKNGIFYIALDDDAKTLNKLYDLNLISFNNEILKCGFPINSLYKYTKMFENDNLYFEIIKEKDINTIIKILEKTNLDKITPIEALNILKRMKDLL